jgi:hypothetical protein
MLELLLGAWLAQTITAAADLGVADALEDGPLHLDELAAEVGADPDALRSTLRALISKGIFAQCADGRDRLTPLTDLLRSNAPISVAALARGIGTPQHREHWSVLTEAIRTGGTQVPVLRGKSFFEDLVEQPDFSAVFHEAMVGLSAYLDEPLVEAYDFTQYRTIVDIAGGHGRFLAAVLAMAPHSKGVLFDLPHVVAKATPLLEKLSVAQRVRVAEGSFFEQVPFGGDAYVLKQVVHDWPDDMAAQILRNVRNAAPTGAALILVETVIPEGDCEFIGKITDTEMFVVNNGRERTAREYRRLLDETGFQLIRIYDTSTDFSVIEAHAR